MNKHSGFTLIEVLIAISIIAVIGLASAQVISSVLKSDEISQQSDERITRWQRTYQTIQRDILQITSRAVRINGGEPQKGHFFAGKYIIDSDDDGIVFTRKGWRNPAQMFPRSTLQSVGYRLRDGTLERLHYLYPDQDSGVEPQVTPLLQGIKGLTLKYYDGAKWYSTWDKSSSPQGIAVVLSCEQWGEIRWDFLVPATRLEQVSNANAT